MKSTINTHLSGGTSLLGSVVLAGALFVCSAAFAQDTAPAKVMFMEDDSKIDASLTGAAGDAVAGRKTFANRKLGNCLACHINPEMEEQSFHGEVGPSLGGVNERYNAAELRAIIVDSKRALSEETLMPGFYSLSVGVRTAGKFKDKTILSAQQVEDVLAYVLTLK